MRLLYNGYVHAESLPTMHPSLYAMCSTVWALGSAVFTMFVPIDKKKEETEVLFEYLQKF